MAHNTYRGSILEDATSSAKLNTRLNNNQKFSKRNFQEWQLSNFAVSVGLKVLDVGCGTGAQTIPIASLIGESGSVSALDYSAESISTLRSNAKTTNIEAYAADMNDLETVIFEKFTCKSYDLIQSTYALYYADNPLSVLDVMRSFLDKDGRLIITVPDTPHGMVSLAARFSEVPAQTIESITFGRQVLEPYFRKHFWNVSIHLFHNLVEVNSVEDFMEMYRATTYYAVEAEGPISAYIQECITANGSFSYEKNAMMIVGKDFI
jgi:ubiquinone/menaquinone biosynthesis C-methylase UbiE